MQLAQGASDQGDSGRSLPYEVVLDMIEMSSDSCLLLNGDWKIVHANQSALRLLGEDLSDFVGKPLEEALGEQCVRAAREKVARSEIGPSGVDDFTHSTVAPDAGQIESSISLGEAPIEVEVDVQKSGELIILLLRPRSGPHKYQERIVELEDELRELRATMAVSQELLRNNNIEVNKSLEKMQATYAELAESNRSATEFLANMSHELRTPLNAILGFLDIILEGLCENDEERTHFLESSQNSANHLLELINDILEVTKIQSGKMTVELSDVDVREIFEQIKVMFEVQARQKDLDLEFEVADPDRPSVFCDSEKLKRVLLNLVSNAIKFTPQGRVRVAMEPYPDDPRTAIISVEDTGIGIPKDQHKRAFERFTQGDGSSTRQYEGTGLGLAICKSLIEKMGGHIWIVKSEENKGTTISFTLPTTSEALEADSTENPDSTADDIGKLLPDTF